MGLKLRRLTGLFILLGMLQAHSQAPGYMGKRFNIGYGFNVSPAIFGATPKNKTLLGDGGSAEYGNLAFNKIHEGFIDFALSRKWMICFSARYYKTAYDNPSQIKERTNPFYMNSRRTADDYFYIIKGQTYTLYFKYYNSKSVAPWGRYVLFGPTLNITNSIYKDVVEKHSTLNFTMGFGRTRIIANRMSIDYGCNFQLFSILTGFADLASYAFDEDILKNYPTTAGNYFERTTQMRARGVNRFNVFLKIGVLLF